MTNKQISQLTAGIALIVASIWIGAWGQEKTGGCFGGSYYAEPAFFTAIFGVMGGIVLIYVMIDSLINPKP